MPATGEKGRDDENGANRIRRGLEEALAHAQGQAVEKLSVHAPGRGDVSGICSRTELSQADDRPPIARENADG